MDKILRGYHNFRNDIFSKQKRFFEQLAEKTQQPKALFITCSDSRIDPNLVTQTEPGDLFILRNAGNIIPPYGSANGGEGATIEYALEVLHIQHVIVCGHSHCGAMKALLEFDRTPTNRHDMPAVANWFAHAEATRRSLRERYADMEGEEQLNAVIEENILVQLNNLTTHPVIATRVSQGLVNLYGWRYEIETGTIFEFDQNIGHFEPMGEVSHPAVPLAIRRESKGEAVTRLARKTKSNGKLSTVRVGSK